MTNLFHAHNPPLFSHRLLSAVLADTGAGIFEYFNFLQ